MALIKTAPIIVSIHGKFGGVYFKKDNSGQHVQSFPRSIRKLSMKKSTLITGFSDIRAGNISSFSTAAAWWVMLIAGAIFYVLYKAFSLEWEYQLREGGTIILPPYQWFMHFNATRPRRKLPPMAIPPKTPLDIPAAETTTDFPPLSYQNFYDIGVWNGKKLYQSQDQKWHCWWLDPSWIISETPGESEEPPYWYRIDESPFGDYIPVEPIFKPASFWGD